ncbi:carbonic anhydrase [Aerococcus kribbianus]|uniref:Carbonic anhydrase n=1 Tax=Aerococcus kribbianus TaxID=2999064 RepID=A0A9X3FXM4_9LACT|nr:MULTISPECIES: carbonic anhydrase [unclassified Aerococcus]MCZ0718019.1 hypothetical protein [Aerococcus sp. YH-aer221]MCZ0726412.1 hypothetical protein [Aerococcus sp. YH-aer222]
MSEDDLIGRYQSFLSDDVAKESEYFASLAKEQHPHTLFITCSDSRVIPERILRADAGEIFHVRNIANIIPEVSRVDQGYGLATMAAIEFAVVVLEVEHIILCGHSNCGGCRNALFPTAKLESMPALRNWLAQLMPLSIQVKMDLEGQSPEVQARALEKLNIVEQYRQLLKLPLIQKKMAADKLQTHAWYYQVHSGEVASYNIETQEFENLPKV